MSEGIQLPNMSELIKVAQKMQRDMSQVQDELAQRRVEGSAGGGMVVAVANGQHELLSIRLEKEIVDVNEIDMLQDLIVAAVNQALTKSAEMAQQELSKVTGGMNLSGGIPNLLNMPFDAK